MASRLSFNPRWLWFAGAFAVICAGLTLAFSPWAFFIGGEFTPSMTWQALGTFQDEIVFLDLAYSPPSDSGQGTADLEGKAYVCNHSGAPVETWKVRLETEAGWLNLNGHKATLDLSRPSGQSSGAVKLFDRKEYKGVWRNPNLIVTGATFTRAMRTQFDSACAGVR